MNNLTANKISTHARPKTLNVTRSDQIAETKSFISEALNAWRAKARCNVVPADRLQELFNELQFSPSEKQIGEMLQTAKVFARKGSKHLNGLTFGEFCVLAADLKRFRASAFSPLNESSQLNLKTSIQPSSLLNYESRTSIVPCNSKIQDNCKQKSPKNAPNKSPRKSSIDFNSPEVFLGGSCNPTTWRADVAIPTLKNLGISFYNPQVSDWTPDLIELEHRAKEKARVLFFVMDSETRASAGAIEAAHIAGQNSKQLVLVLHSYKENQKILNEPISQQEYMDLIRNQELLRELVIRRGIPVLDNIQSALHRTKAILAGIRDPPSKIASILIVVRGAFERVVRPLETQITLEQCQRALLLLGYAHSLITIENLTNIIKSQRDSLQCSSLASASDSNIHRNKKKNSIHLNFDEFCVLAAYLSVLQQEIYESGCISPIKGTNLPPPPIFLANMQEDIQNRTIEESVIITSMFTKQILRASSCTNVPDDRHNNDIYRSRDSGTSSPQPIESTTKSRSIQIEKKTKTSLSIEYLDNGETGEESDSNDSVFSSGSSINSYLCDTFTDLEFRDIYLGGSCYLRTKWRQDFAIPYLNSKGITYHLPALHESILSSNLNHKSYSDNCTDDINKTLSIENDGVKKKSKGHKKNNIYVNANDCYENDFDDCSSLLPLRSNLFNPALLDSSRVLLFVITNETRSLAPMTLAAHCIGLMYNVVLCVQMLPDFCVIGSDRLTPTAIKDYNRGRSYLIDLAKRQDVPVFSDLKSALACTVEKVKACNSRNSV